METACRYLGYEHETGKLICLLMFYALNYPELPDEVVPCETCNAKNTKMTGRDG
jgi:hypothetical protein